MVPSASFARLSGLLYDAALDPARTEAAMTGLQGVLGEAMFVFGIVGAPGGPQLFHGDCTPEYGELFFEPRLANPLLPHLAATGRSEVLCNDDLMPPDRFRRTPFFNEWLRPQQATSLAFLKAPLADGGTALLGLQRGGRARNGGSSFAPAEIELLRCLAPVVARTAAIRRLRAGSGGGGPAVGQAIVDAAARLIAADPVAEALAAAPGSGLAFSQRRVGLRAGGKDTALDHCILACVRDPEAAPAGRELLVRPSEPGGPLLLVQVTPFVGAGKPPGAHRLACLRIEDLTARIEPAREARLRALFALTRREASLAIALAAGRSLAEHASARNVSLETVRSQLRGVFAKTDTSRQGELVALLGRLVR